MSFPILYEGNATDFFSMGLGVLADAIKCEVTEERNGKFELNMEYPKDGVLFKELKNNRIIKVDVGHDLPGQRFYIEKITRNFKGTVNVFATHCSYLTEKLSMKPLVSANGSADAALNKWKNSLIGNHPFVVDSDIQRNGKISWNLKDVDNPRLALGGVKGSVLDVYGGEYRFDNYHISLMSARGSRKGYRISYGRNLTDVEQEESITNVYTSIYPFAIQREDKQNKQEEQLITVDGFLVHSEHVDKYPYPISVPVDFTSEFEQDEKITQKKLKELAVTYIKSNSIGIPRVSMTVEFVDLEQTLDYQGSNFNEKLNLCDEVEIYFETMGIVTTDKVTSITWDVLKDRYSKINVGDAPRTLGSKIKDMDGKVQEAEKNANNALTSANGKNTNFYGPDEPVANKIGDTWFKDIGGGEYEIYQWNGTIWELVSYDISIIEEELAKHKEDIQTSLDKADKAIEEAGFSKDTAEEAKEESKKAFEEAEKQGGKLKKLSVDLDKEKNKITVIQTDVEDGKVNIHKLESDAESSKETISNIDGKVTSVEKNVNGIQQAVEDKVDKSEHTQLAGLVQTTIKDSGVPNLVTNSGVVGKNTESWTFPKAWYPSASQINGNVRWGINIKETGVGLNRLSSEAVPIDSSKKISVSYVYSIVSMLESDAMLYVGVQFLDKDLKSVGFVENKHNTITGTKYVEDKMDGVEPPGTAKYARFSATLNHAANAYVGKPMMTVTDEAVSYKPNGTSQSQITQTKEMIDLRVEKAGVISAVNVSPEGILLLGKKIMLDGDVTMNTAFINKLTVNSAFINSIKAIDIDASRITSGKISGIYIDLDKKMTISENGTIEATYSYGEIKGKAYDARYYDGSSRVGKNFMSFITDVYEPKTATTHGAFRYHARSFIGGDTFKLRQYNSSASAEQGKDPWYHLDATAQYIAMGNGFDTEIYLDSRNGIITAKDTEFTNATIHNGENDWGLSCSRYNAKVGQNSLRINYNRGDLGNMLFGKDATSDYVQSVSIYNRRYKTGDGRIVISSSGIMGIGTSLRAADSPMLRSSSLPMDDLLEKVTKLTPVRKNPTRRAFQNDETPRSVVSYSAKEVSEIGLKELCYLDKDGEPIDMVAEKFIVVQMELIKGLQEKVKLLEEKIDG